MNCVTFPTTYKCAICLRIVCNMHIPLLTVEYVKATPKISSHSSMQFEIWLLLSTSEHVLCVCARTRKRGKVDMPSTSMHANYVRLMLSFKTHPTTWMAIRESFLPTVCMCTLFNNVSLICGDQYTRSSARELTISSKLKLWCCFNNKLNQSVNGMCSLTSAFQLGQVSFTSWLCANQLS